MDQTTDSAESPRDFSDYAIKNYYSVGSYRGQVPVAAIVAEVYGKEISLLEANTVDRDGLANDTLVSINLSDEGTYQEALQEFDSTEIVLGYDQNWKSILKRGLTAMDYWLSVKITSDYSAVTHPQEDGIQDLEGATLLSWDGRVPPPGLRSILADLMRRGQIPRGDYLFYHSW